jgi:hypothetical protein
MLTLDRMARRYGRLPHELAELDPFELSVCLACMLTGEAAQADEIQRVTRNPKAMVFPVIVVGG